MRCKQCHNEMNKTDEVVELRTRQTWFECPVCESVHTTSQRTAADNDRRIGNTLRFSAAMLPPHYSD